MTVLRYLTLSYIDLSMIELEFTHVDNPIFIVYLSTCMVRCMLHHHMTICLIC